MCVLFQEMMMMMMIVENQHPPSSSILLYINCSSFQSGAENIGEFYMYVAYMKMLDVCRKG